MHVIHLNIIQNAKMYTGNSVLKFHITMKDY